MSRQVWREMGEFFVCFIFLLFFFYKTGLDVVLSLKYGKRTAFCAGGLALIA